MAAFSRGLASQNSIDARPLSASTSVDARTFVAFRTQLGFARRGSFRGRERSRAGRLGETPEYGDGPCRRQGFWVDVPGNEFGNGIERSTRSRSGNFRSRAI